MTLSLSWLSELFFITIRIGTVFLFTPIQAIRQLPVHLRLLLIFIFSYLLLNQIPAPTPLNNEGILLAGIVEFSNGLILSTSLYAAFAVFQIAGQMIDNEIGLNSLALFNPAEHSQDPLSSRLLSMLAVLFFFGLQGHLWLFKGLAYSFVIIPPGSLTLFAGFSPVIKQFGFMFSLALIIASPIIITLLIIDLSGAVITRNMPQISTYFITLPVKILLGFILLAMMLNYFPPLAAKVFDHCFNTWQAVMS